MTTSGPAGDKPLTEQLKAKLDELELERHLSEAAAQAEELARTGVGRAGEYVHERRDAITGFLDKAVASIDERTSGRFADTVATVRGYVDTGVAKIADQRPDTGAGTGEAQAAGDDPTT